MTGWGRRTLGDDEGRARDRRVRVRRRWRHGMGHAVYRHSCAARDAETAVRGADGGTPCPPDLFAWERRHKSNTPSVHSETRFFYGLLV